MIIMSVKDFIKKSVLESDVFGNIELPALIAGLLCAFLMGVVIYCVYKHYYLGAVYNRSFGLTLIGMSVLTCMVTLAISSNLVISLGMIGALSIVRFRTAVKNPLDMLYLFWAITAGITAGADMYLLMALAALIMIPLIIVFNLRRAVGKIYIMVIHYQGDVEEKILAGFGSRRCDVKSKTLRGGSTELAVEVFCHDGDTSFAQKIQEIDGVRDLTMIQYNGEYHG